MTIGVSVQFSTTAYVSEKDMKAEDYIIITDDKRALDDVLGISYKSEIIENDFSDKSVSKVSLTKSDADEVEEIDGVLTLEPDSVVSGSERKTKKMKFDPVLDSMFKNVDSENINQWNLEALGADITTQKTKVKVKVELLDSGVSMSNDIDVKSRVNLVDEENFNPLYEDISQHGTGMAGAICAKDNGVNITGVNPNAELYSVKVLDSKLEAPISRIIEGIYWGIENGMNVINMSFGTSVNSSALRTAVKDAYNAGIVMVASSGNVSISGVQYPAAYPEVISVGAQTSDGDIADFTSVGDNLDVIAPGENVESTGIFDTINGSSGTSIAAAQVSGIASKILEKDKSKSPDFVKSLIMASAKRVNDRGVVTGSVDCEYALSIYDVFGKTYTPEKNTNNYENPESVEVYDNNSFVKGLWCKEEHRKLAEKVESQTPNENALNLIIKGAVIADYKKYFKKAKCADEELDWNNISVDN